MNFLTKDKTFYKQMFTLAIPIAMQNLINFSVSMADAVMGGILGEVPLAAATLANKFGLIFMLLTFGLGSGANVMIAQYWGKKDTESIKHIMTLMYRVLFVGAGIFTIIAILFPFEAMRLFSTDPAVQKVGAEYLRIIGFSYFMQGFVTTTLTVHRAVGSVKVAMGIFSISLVLNLLVDWTLIFGKFGAPRMGIVGSAIGTVVGRCIEIILLFFYLIKYEDKIRYKVSDFFKTTKGYVTKFGKIVTPVIINEIFWATGSTLFSIIIGRMGTSFTAAESVCSIIGQFVTIFIWGIAHASGTIIGNTIGEGKEDKAKEYGKTMLVMSFGLGIAACLVVLLVRDPVISLFNITETGKLYAAEIINVLAVMSIFQSVSAVCLIGVLRGAGNSKFVMVVDLIFLWTLSLPLGYITGLKMHMPIVIVYLVLKSDELFKAIAVIIKLAAGNWVHNVVEEQPELIEM